MSKKGLSIVFMGTPDFAVPSLEAIVANGYDVKAVVTAPDRTAGRGLELRQSPVKKAAIRHNISVLQPTNLKSEEFQTELDAIGANLYVVVAFRMLPEKVWAKPELGTFNLHASLLPDYRGAAPINWAIINGETTTGLTTFFLRHEIDTGAIIAQEKVDIGSNESAGELHDRLMVRGAGLVLHSLEKIEAGELETRAQGEFDPAKHAPKIFRDNCRIRWKQDVGQIHNFIRGLSPHPAAWTTYNGKVFKIYSAVPLKENHSYAPGQLFVRENEPCVAAENGWLKLNEVQLQGKKRMTAADFLRGQRELASELI